MTRSQVIALRCAAALPVRLLLRRFPDPRRKPLADLHGVPDNRRSLPSSLIDQLERCQSEEAQRILLGVSR